MNNELKKISFYRDWYFTAALCNNEERLLLYDTMFKYAFLGVDEKTYNSNTVSVLMEKLKAEVEKIQDVKQKRTKAANARYCKCNANAMQMQCKCNANAEKQAQNPNTGHSAQDLEEYEEVEVIEELQEEKKKSNIKEIKEEDINNISLLNNNNKIIIKEREKEKREKESTREFSAFCNEIMDYWNEMMQGTPIPSIKSMTGQRKSALKARLTEFGRQEIINAIQATANSPFLTGMTGANGRRFVANFDWVFGPKNFMKVIEGNFNDNNENINFYGTGYKERPTTDAECDATAIRAAQRAIAEEKQDIELYY